ncbi:hypothetical protein ASG63_08450 [Methylobacterium sp. Leaf94]|uniref:hypothetical protein n=1 Tax=Methylobacterium sp. Leaf94 TaxID=1736250 RepID=UPI0006F4D288|nr:hypothetical protein [Methylobacterium sp. Leaf94]KQU17531.1 hypothetical protein ASG63_08450 [Methylobacterium sp. Leaf94]
MAGLSLDVLSDICDQVAAYERAFLSEASLDRYRRACAWTTSEVAKEARNRANEAVEDAFDNPTPWMRRAFAYKRALTKKGDIIQADVSVLPSQSIVLKYAMGSGPQIRRPGDAGLAKDRILVPYWRNLRDTQGISYNAYGNLPGGVAARLAREAAGTTSKRRVSGRWGVYKGELDVGGSRVAGYIARPFRGEAPIGKNGRSIVVNLGRPKILLGAITQARYAPVMQAPYDEAVRKAVDRIPELMEGELADAIEYRANRPPRDMRRLG